MERWDAVDLSGGWRLLSTPAGAVEAPSGLPDGGDWLPAPVPGTVAGALRAAGRWRDGAPAPLHGNDHWYALALRGHGAHRLCFAGLTPPAEIWLDGALLRRVGSMFVAEELEVTLHGEHRLHLCFRSLSATLAGKRGRARWRPQLVADQRLRQVRTTLLGHMPGWCPPVDAVGPWRAVTLAPSGAPRVRRLRARLDGDAGVIKAELDAAGHGEAFLEAGGQRAPLERDGERLRGTLRLPAVARWWPHTHGEPALHAVSAVLDGRTVPLGRVGFRALELERSADGRDFGFRVNGEPVFLRGACWTSAALAELPAGRDALRPWLELARNAGFNAVRVSGTGVYEDAAFHALCDELGIMVWQDAMFAALDYPADDPELLALARREVEELLERTAASPSMLILCGSSERSQAATMRGLPPEACAHPLFDEIFPEAVSRIRPDLPYVPDSPSGGALPFGADAGVTHYYGVGAYMRPLEDARRAGVRFAAECLAFSNVPAPATLAALGVPPGHHPRWKERVPRDTGAPWDFEDVRDHYLGLLYAVDPPRLRATDPERYLMLSRAVSADVMEAVFAEWRRPGSTCAGGLVWQLQDLWEGAGWGVVDSRGRPKAAWHGLRRALQPVQVLLSDEGVNGHHLHLLNERAAPCPVRLAFTCLRDGAAAVARAERDLVLPARGALTVEASALLGRFFDTTYAYRFGPPSHDAVVAELRCADTDALLSRAAHFPTGRALPRADLGLDARVARDGAGWVLRLRSERLAQAVHLDLPGWRGAEEWFHLPPGREHRVALLPDGAADADVPPEGEVLALNALFPVACRFEEPPR